MNMFKDGLATFQLKRMQDKVEALRKGVFLSDENVFTQRQRYLPPSHKEDPNINLDDLGKP